MGGWGRLLWLAAGLWAGSVGCADGTRSGPDAGAPRDAGATDAGSSGSTDAARDDGAGGPGALDAGGSDPLDGGPAEGGSAGGGAADGGAAGEAGAGDGGTAGGGTADGGAVDAGPVDAGAPDAGPSDPTGGCISGATGTHVARFRWNGTTSGSTAWVSYEANTLPDTSRWRAGAYSRSIGYTPVFRDPYLGEGGLELSGNVFIDVELSTLGLGSVRNVTLAIYGRSYHTTTSGSFEWMTFSGSGASPYGGVSNAAPYEWYRADATAALPAGDDGTLLRIEAGGPSNALIVNRVEICFDAP